MHMYRKAIGALYLSSIFSLNQGLPDQIVIQNLMDLSESAYQAHLDKVRRNIHCEVVKNAEDESLGIVCQTEEGLVYRKDDTDRT